MNKLMLAVAALLIVSVNSQASDVSVPDAASALPLLGFALGGLAVAKSFFAKKK